jgi:putative SOS response-associated peptidase YedK
VCGRFTLRYSAREIAEQFALDSVPDLVPRYNVAPTQQVLVIRLHDGTRHGSWLRWGLIPSWADDPAIGNRLLNARSETVAEKPAFRSAFKRSRCLVVADGFYEWKKNGKTKQPYFIHMKSEKTFAFAGLSERWKRDDKVIESCTIVTTDANPHMAELHDRMPVILSPADYDVWLDAEFQSQEKLLSLLQPFDAEKMAMYPVSAVVNSPKNEQKECIEPLA